MIIFNNLCPVVRPNLLHPGTLVPSEVGLAGRHLCRSVSDSSGALRRPPDCTLWPPEVGTPIAPSGPEHFAPAPPRRRETLASLGISGLWQPDPSLGLPGCRRAPISLGI